MEQKKKSKMALTFVILIVAIIVCTCFMSYFASSQGFVKIQRIELIGDDGLTYSALMMIPANATNETPAPLFVDCHGGSADARAMETWGLEMARRGFVCVLPDGAGGGASEKYSITARDERYNYITEPVITMMDYALSLPIVDSDNITIAGISQGGNPCRVIAEDYADQVKCVIFVNTNQCQPYDCNVLYYQGTKDTVAQSGNEGIFVDGWLAPLYTDFEQHGITSNDQIELGKVYGNFADGTAKMFDQTTMTHAAGTFNHATMAALTDFAMQSAQAYGANIRYVDPDDSIWEAREAFGLILAILICALVPVTACLLMDQIPYFGAIRQPLPKNIGFLAGKNKIGFAISTGLGIIMPIVFFEIKAVSGVRRSSVLFPAYFLNMTMLWLALLTAFGVIMFFVYHYTEGKKRGGNIMSYGIKRENIMGFDWRMILCSVILALIVELVVNFVLKEIEVFTGLTPHFWFVNFAPAVSNRLTIMPIYILCFFVAFFVSGLSMNVERRLPDTGNEVRDMARSIIVNVLIAGIGITILLLVQWIFGYNAMAQAGDKNAFNNLVAHSHFGLSFTIGAAAAINTFIYRKSGNITTPAIITAVFMGVTSIVNTCI